MKLKRPRLSLVKENEVGSQCGCRNNRCKGTVRGKQVLCEQV